MKRSAVLLMLLAGIAATPLAAQKNRPTTTGPDADRDGVADATDRCPSTLPNVRVGRDGCPLSMAPAAPQGAAAAAPRDTAAATTSRKGGPPPRLVGAPAQGQQAPQGGVTAGPPAAPRDTAAPASAAGAAPAPGNPVVTQQAVPSTPARTPPAASAFTAGLAAPTYGDATPAGATAYVRQVAPLLDSAIVTLVGVFRNTSGQPVMGALDPSAISGRERGRWTQCRNLYWDLTTYRNGFHAALEDFMDGDANAALAPAAAALDSALDMALADTAAVAECDNVSSMIAAPARWTPWEQQYQAAARRFYGGWYDAIRGLHDRHRAFVVAFNGTVPAAQRVTVPPALQRNPPYAGAGPRE